MWKFVNSGVEGNCNIFGVNIFNYEWEDTGEEVEVVDPIYEQKHIFSVYCIKIGSNTVKFAAGEFSNCVYGFYVYE